MKKYFMIAAILLALSVMLSGCAATFTASAAEPEKTVPEPSPAPVPVPVQPEEFIGEVTVSASGTVTLVPDKAILSFGVITEDEKAEAAQKKNTESVNKVIETLKARGVEEKSIRTANYNMYPRYDWSQNKETIIGYTVNTTITVQDQGIDEMGKIISACVEAGINRVESVRFLCSGYDEAYLDALGKAMDTARIKGEALAKAAGRTLAEAVTVSEGWQDTSSRYGKNANVPSMAAEESYFEEASIALQPGETEITANVTVTYKMR
ncbi:MAG: SIMPL domain-containing protein [Firmicutes bacterium]|nr:SIMPL domain-containing protein [Bacillota bacterium]